MMTGLYNNPGKRGIALPDFSFRFLFLAILFGAVSACEKEARGPTRSELLVSTIWENTESCGTVSPEPGMFTCIFEPGGRYRSYYKAFETANYPWRLKDNSSLYINNIESKITELTKDRLELWGPGGSIFRIFDVNCDYKFKSLPGTKVTTAGVSGLSKTSAILHGYVRTIEDAEVSAEYGISTVYGNSAGPVVSMLTGINNKIIEIPIHGLLPETSYHYRLKAVTPTGIYYGADHKFRTFNEVSITDADDNEYNTLTIGAQTWMAEPLKTTKYNDDTSIPNVSDSLEWTELSTPAYCWYKNDPLTYKDKYGALYNWHVVNSGKLCPLGWHVPEKEEWLELVQYLGEDAGDKLTEGHYDINLTTGFLEASNETGFSAVETFTRSYFGSFDLYLYDCALWCSNEDEYQNGFSITVDKNHAFVSGMIKEWGLPVRCIKD